MDQTNTGTVAATLECLDGIVLSLVFDGIEEAESWEVGNQQAALARIAREAREREVEVALTLLGDPLPLDFPAQPRDGRLRILPGGDWLPDGGDPSHSSAATPSATLTHRLSHGIPESSGDLFDIDAAEFTDPTPDIPQHPAASARPEPVRDAMDDFFTTPDVPPAQSGVPGAPGGKMSRGELDEWVARELLNPEKATKGSATIRTATEAAGPTRRQRVLGAAALAVLLVVGVTGVAGLALNGSDERKPPKAPVVGPFDIKPAVLAPASGPGPDSLSGYRTVWDFDAQGDSVAVTPYAAIRATGQTIKILDPATGKKIADVHAYGQMKALLSGKVTDGRHSTTVFAWQYEDILNVQALDGDPVPKPAKVALPPKATVSARLDGILVTDPADTTKVGLLVAKPRKSGAFGVRIRWIDAPVAAPPPEAAEETTDGENKANSIRPVAATNARQWGYAATPGGEIWWLNNDGTAVLPGPTTTTLTAGQPQEGMAFAGWLGAGFGETPDPSKSVNADVLVGVWRDPVASSLVLATYDVDDAKTGAKTKPVAAVAVAADVAATGTSGATSRTAGIGTWLIDADTAQIIASGTRHTIRVAGVYGDLALLADRGGHLRFVTYDLLAGPKTQKQSSAPEPGTAQPAVDDPAQPESESTSGPGDVEGLVTLDIERFPYTVLGATADGLLVVRDGDKIMALRPTAEPGL